MRHRDLKVGGGDPPTRLGATLARPREKPLGVLLLLGLPALAMFEAGCGRDGQRVPTRGVFAGKLVETTVDSGWARAFLARDGGAPGAPALEAGIERARQEIRASGTGPETLARVAREYSPDLATLLLAEALLADERNAQLQARYAGELGRLEAGLPASEDVRGAGLAILFAPGWLYQSHPGNGAGFERQLALAARMGIDAERISTDENGSVERNAGVIAGEIRRRRGEGRRYILASASKAGAEVALALSMLAPDEADPVAAWVNIGGVLGGTPLADDALTAPRCWGALALFGWRKGGLDGLRSMATAVRRERLAGLTLPGHVLVVNYVPLPLSGDLSAPARSGYDSMRELGPNDGLALTTDEILPGGATIVEAGLDHYMTAPDIDRRTEALIRVVVGALEER